MRYSIGQVAQKMGLTAHTLRYYDKEGLLPFVKKNSSGLRMFSDEDIDWLVVIECLKGTGMQLKDSNSTLIGVRKVMPPSAGAWKCLNVKK